MNISKRIAVTERVCNCRICEENLYLVSEMELTQITNNREDIRKVLEFHQYNYMTTSLYSDQKEIILSALLFCTMMGLKYKNRYHAIYLAYRTYAMLVYRSKERQQVHDIVYRLASTYNGLSTDDFYTCLNKEQLDKHISDYYHMHPGTLDFEHTSLLNMIPPSAPCYI